MTDTPLPPSDLTCEGIVLGLLLTKEKAVLPVMERLAGRWAFYSDTHMEVFNAAWRLWMDGKHVTAATVRTEANIDKPGAVIDKVVGEAKGWSTDEADLPTMCQLLLELKERRDYLLWAELAKRAALDMKKPMELVRARAMLIPKTIGAPLDADPRVDNGLDLMMKRAADTERKDYVATGFPRLDDLLGGGLAPGTLTVLGARRSVGKTAIASAIALHAMRRGKKVVWVSCEMGRVEMLGRWTTALSGVALFRRVTKLTDEEQPKVDKAVTFLSYSQPIVIDNAMTIDALVTSATRWRAQGRLDLLVVDYLQIMRMPPGNAMHERLSEFIVGLKQLAQKLGLPVLTLAQCRRESDPDRARLRVRMAHLKGTGGLEETADSVVLAWPSDRANVVDCHLAKNRHGPAGMFSLFADFNLMKIGGYDARHD